ncbi:MAG TPA: hypothetical protein VMR52_07405 [Dehalococcoidia bacterium]|nr:hypothetical protein [Dehalococcoidia bacterium]
MSDDWRSLNDWEASIIDRMLDVDFPGRPELRQQLEGCLVRQYDDHGCIEFRVVQDIVAPVGFTVPVEARGHDQDGATVDVLLFVKGGRLAS